MRFFCALKTHGAATVKDLKLLAALYLAHLIVWRTLRRKQKERLARLKCLRVIGGLRSAAASGE